VDELRGLTAPDGAALCWARSRPAAPQGVLVLLHGLASNMSRWAEFTARTALAARWTILRPDLRGQGRSVWRGRAGMQEWCEDLARMLDAEGAARAVVGGHCLGANLALEFAARHPHRVAGLILVEPMPRAALAGKYAVLARAAPFLRAAAALVRALNALGFYRRRLAALDLEQLDRETRAALAQGPQGEALLRRYASPLADLKTTPLAAYLQALAATVAPGPEPSAIAAPILALIAAGALFTDSRRVRAWLAGARDCEIVELAAKHWIPTESPEPMRAAIEDWIGRRFAGGV
jgi:pimeloyl-ACP methyl ester carboxylesterase